MRTSQTDIAPSQIPSLQALERINARAIDLAAGRLDQMGLHDDDTEGFDRGARTALQLLRLAITAGEIRIQHIKEQSADEARADEEGLSDDRLGELVREHDEKLNRLSAGGTHSPSEADRAGNQSRGSAL